MLKWSMRLHSQMTNLEIANLFRALAASLKLKNEVTNKFRIIAYDRAADAVEHLSTEAKDLFDEGKLNEIPGVGESISKNLSELFQKGISKHFESILKGIPVQVFILMDLPRIGAKTALKLVENLGLHDSKDPISDLKKKCLEGDVSQLEGFGGESQSDILEAIEEFRRNKKRLLLPYASQISEDIISWMKNLKEIEKIDALGSIRRQASSVGDIDIAVSSKTPHKALEHFIRYPKASRVIEKGEKTASILLPGGIQVDLMVSDTSSYGSLLQHFTGSKHHNIALREHALKKGLSLSEYGIKKTGADNTRPKKFSDETAFYNHLGLSYIPPELREDMGEIEAAKEKKIPHLITLKDVKGDLQIHTSFNTETHHDLGESTMEEIIKKAMSLGYEYIAFTEHNPSHSNHSETQIMDILKRKRELVDKLNYSNVKTVKYRVIKIYNSLELDILPDGNLPINEAALNTLDFALVSIHSSFRQDKKTMTQRVLAALSNPKVKIFAHPTARKINMREGVEIDWSQIFDYAVKNNKIIEINGDPARLDLPDFLVKEGLKYGVTFSLGTDSHHAESLDNMCWAVSVARRGWLEVKNVVNCLDTKEFEKIVLERR